MNPLEVQLCWTIINCPRACPAQCNSIVSLQGPSGVWQIPEPWNGSLTSKFLIIAGNPALDTDELYPSTHSPSNLTWVGPGVWNQTEVQCFFEGRFGISKNKAFPNNPYVDVSTNPPAVLLKSGSTKNPKNPYWEIANKICSLLDNSFQPWSFAFTDIVHCKSSNGKGNPPFNTCRHHTKSIVDLFAQLSTSDPTVILIGADANRQKDYFFWTHPVSSNNLGSYDFKRNGIIQKRHIIDESFSYNSNKLRVISGIPAPSKANGQVRNVTIGGTVIW